MALTRPDSLLLMRTMAVIVERCIVEEEIDR